MDDEKQLPIYIGSWTNWDQGKVHGATLTLRREDSNILIAFLAFFIAWGESSPPLPVS